MQRDCKKSDQGTPHSLYLQTEGNTSQQLNSSHPTSTSKPGSSPARITSQSIRSTAAKHSTVFETRYACDETTSYVPEEVDEREALESALDHLHECGERFLGLFLLQSHFFRRFGGQGIVQVLFAPLASPSAVSLVHVFECSCFCPHILFQASSLQYWDENKQFSVLCSR
jgi:hypothetical protein